MTDKPKHAGGRPPKYKKPSDMEAVIESYFAKCDEEKRPYTIMGLALALDLTRQGLCEYAEKGEFSDLVKKAKSKVELSVEERLFGPHATGSIFWLKNHAGYKDKHETEITGENGSPLTFIMDFSGKNG